VTTKPDINPMHTAPRCTAHSKRTGFPCKAPAVRGWGSQASIEKYALEKFRQEPKNIAIATLVIDFLANVEERGWKFTGDEIGHAGIKLPAGKLVKIAMLQPADESPS
jgi:hypothetical protein